jgi:DNA-binding CsgD family transcriptional regulator
MTHHTDSLMTQTNRCVDLFRRGHNTLSIARLLKITEAEAYNAIARRNSAKQSEIYAYKRKLKRSGISQDEIQKTIEAML